MGSWVMQMLALLPYIVSGIEHIHGDAKSGAQKKQLAMEAVGLGANVASVADPKDQPVIAASQKLASDTIDNVVAVMNATKNSQTAQVPAAPAAGATA